MASCLWVVSDTRGEVPEMSARRRERKKNKRGKPKGESLAVKPQCDEAIDRHVYSSSGKTWHVDRLWRLSKDLTPYKMPLGYFARELDDWHWGEEITLNIFIEHMKRVADANLLLPIILSAEGDVMDGMHRLARSAYIGVEWIWVVRFPVTPEPDCLY